MMKTILFTLLIALSTSVAAAEPRMASPPVGMSPLYRVSPPNQQQQQTQEMRRQTQLMEQQTRILQQQYQQQQRNQRTQDCIARSRAILGQWANTALCR